MIENLDDLREIFVETYLDSCEEADFYSEEELEAHADLAWERLLDSVRAPAWEEGRMDMVFYTQGARKKVPYPKNPYIPEGERKRG